MTDSLPELIEQLKIYFDCEAITIFAVDQAARQLYSINPISEKVPEIRISISRRIGTVSPSFRARIRMG
jgi:hypothetical protein